MSKHISKNEKENLFSSFKAGSKRLLSTLVLFITIWVSPFALKAQIDPLEYPPGHPNVTVSVTDQIKTFPLPRYKTGHTMLPNFNWMDPTYFGGRFQSGVSDAQAVTNSVDIQTELAKNFNYYLLISWSSDNFNTAWKNLANANPQYKVGLVTLRAQTRGSNPSCAMWSQTYANDHYMQTSTGQFIDAGGNNTSNKTWRPTTPVSDYNIDGQVAKGFLSSALSNLTRPVDMVNEDGEVYPIMENNALQKDPVVTAAKNASGLDWENYYGKQVRLNDNGYSSQFMSLPILSSAKYTEYRLDGHRDYQLRWEQSKFMNSPINGSYYSTSDFYVRWPSNWKDWQGPWHGLKWMTQSRHFEIAAGDKLFSPFVAAGYDANPENDVRPAQWLGLLKLLGMYGAEFYYTGYFNEQGNYNPPNPPPYDPKGYAWQAVMPSYSQGISSCYESILRTSSLMAGDMTDNSNSTGPIPYYQFTTGASNKVVAVRKKDNANIYAISGTIQNSSNVIGSTPLTSDVTIKLNGQDLQFSIRRQGSTYIYDNSVPTAPVFYQLDGWHEASHPYRWTKDFNFEGELFDNVNSNAVIKTSVPAGTAAGDFRNATSYVSFNAVSDLQYTFQPRGTSTSNYYLWVRVRSKNGTSTGFTASLDGGASQQFSCITDGNWQWYRFNVSSQAVSYPSVSLATHKLKITPSSTSLEIDKISLVTSSGAVYSGPSSPCAAGSATITASGATTFCQGGNVTLTASSGTNYLWSTGATTNAITVSTSGNYTVTVTSGGSSAVSAPVSVNVNSLPTSSITANGPLTFTQGGSVILTASNGSSYLWSPGNQTTQSITVTTSGTFTVRVTNSNGCSAISSPVTVTVNAGGGTGTTATISANGPTSFCLGGNVTLSANSGVSYLWSSGQTSQSITVSSSGVYLVTVVFVTNTSTSAPVTVTAFNCTSCPIATGLFETSVTANSASLNWSPVNNVDNLQIRLVEAVSGFVYITGEFSGSLSQITVGALPNTKYRWRIRSKCSGVYTVWSDVGHFTTLPARIGEPPLNNGELEELYLDTSQDTQENDGFRLSKDENFLMNVFPNPASGSATLSFTSPASGSYNFKLVDFTGRTIRENKIEVTEGLNNYLIDLKNYPPGVYLTMLEINGANYSKKILIR